MGLRITIDVFSGRPNPVVELDDNEAGELRERLTPTRRLEEGEALPPELPLLGYHGIEIAQTGNLRDDRLPRQFRVAGSALFGVGVAHAARDDRVEDFILGRDGPVLRRVELDDAVLEALQIDRRRLLERWKVPDLDLHWPWPFPLPCPCGPVYEPGWWNVPARQPSNNCYNYASNYRTDTFAQPGRAAGAMYSALTCPAVHSAALADMLVAAPGATHQTCPTEGHLVALVIWPGVDFHWYRHDRSGWWSHKPGGTPVTDRDNSNHYILNPETADRGPYSEFCGYLVVMHGHIKIG